MLRDLNYPSALDRRAKCPGSMAQEMIAPPQPDSDDSKMGTRCHEAATAILTGAFVKDLSEEEMEWVNWCVQEVKDIEKTINPETLKEALIINEKKLSLSSMGIARNGKMDRAYICGETAWIIDFKFGVGWVNAPKYNYQAKAYAVSVAEELGVKKVYFHFLQPRATNPDEMNQTETWNEEDIQKHKEDIIRVVEKTKDSLAPLNPSTNACKFCEAKEFCPAKTGATQAMVAIKGDLGEYVESLDARG